MTRDEESTPFQTVIQLLATEGFDGVASAQVNRNAAANLLRFNTPT